MSKTHKNNHLSTPPSWCAFPFLFLFWTIPPPEGAVIIPTWQLFPRVQVPTWPCRTTTTPSGVGKDTHTHTRSVWFSDKLIRFGKVLGSGGHVTWSFLFSYFFCFVCGLFLFLVKFSTVMLRKWCLTFGLWGAKKLDETIVTETNGCAAFEDIKEAVWRF